MKDRLNKRPSLDELVEGIDQSNRVMLSRAITLVESKLPSDRDLAMQLMDRIVSKAGRSLRIGITGVPGVGKSTFIEAFGSMLTSMGKKVAVLSVDPSSTRSKGSILGDKTRMNNLSMDSAAFIRPSPSGNSLGGVAQKTRESIMLCEAAGYDVVLVETVGVGQSEVAVKNMVDFFLLLMLAGGGDELQGIKRGIMEMADALVINKSDGNNLKAAKQAKKSYQNALHLFPPHESGWVVPVTLCSALESSGINEIWEIATAYSEKTKTTGYFDEHRKRQQLLWMNELIKAELETAFYADEDKRNQIKILESKVIAGELSVRHAIIQLFN